MNAREGIHPAFLRIEMAVGTLYFARLYIGPSHQAHSVIEEEITFGLSLAHYQTRRKGSSFSLLIELLQVYVTQYVDIMYKDWLGRIEEHPSLFDATSRFQQFASLVTDADVHPEIVAGVEIINNLV